ncbi:hypothetical protein J4E08_00200 [Sagittula sp. NFXS13]|uniref:hypothetical protein n=1 Tax=Sagittula sp. NFXS13 TaxID=2819095 RepID=UPI0032DE2CF0
MGIFAQKLTELAAEHVVKKTGVIEAIYLKACRTRPALGHPINVFGPAGKVSDFIGAQAVQSPTEGRLVARRPKLRRKFAPESDARKRPFH